MADRGDRTREVAGDGAGAQAPRRPAPGMSEYDPAMPRIVWGPGCAQQLEQQLDRLGVRRALLLAGRSLGGSEWLRAFRERLGSRCAGVFGAVEPHTPLETLRAAVSHARDSRADCLVMIGGGSVQDTGKLAALVLAEGEDLEAHRVRWTRDRRLIIPALAKEKLPLIAVPTTLSAAEVVGAATYVDGHKRFVIVDRALLPRVVMYDSKLAVTTPAMLFMGTGINAIAHCVEAVYSVRAQPFSDALAVGSLRLLIAGLAECAKAPESAAAREQALIGAAMSGIAYANTWLGVAHSLCQALGARYRVAQGLLHAVILPHAMRFNRPATEASQERIRGVFRDSPASRALADGADDTATLVARFIASLGLPARLRELEVPEAGLAQVAEDAFEIWHTYFNPRRVESPEELRQVLAAAW